MTVQQTISEDTSFETYRFGRARQRYRGPKPDMSQPYATVIGGSETYGKFATAPYPALLDKSLDFTVANFGTPGAGPGFFLKDPVLLESLSASRACVITVMDAPPVSNRLYSVFKRRNAKLQGSSEMMKAMYPQIDEGEFKYVSGLLAKARELDPAKFEVLEYEIRSAWIGRMKELLESIETHKILFWLSSRRPEDPCPPDLSSTLASPCMVNKPMFDSVANYADATVQCIVPADLGGSVVRYPSPKVHEIAAKALRPMLTGALNL